jgi:glycopeptide antibiotics resistance protein
MLEFFPYPFLLGFALLVILLTDLRKKHPPAFLFFYALFWIYILLLIGITLFPIPFFTQLLSRSNLAYILSRINWIPFRISLTYRVNLFPPDVIGNILLTIPFGLGIPFLKRIQPGEMVLFSMIGFVIELSQLMISLYLGMAFRTVDITDVITNCAGVWLGYGLFRGFAWLYNTWIEKYGIRQDGFFKYLTEVTRQS